MDKIFEREFENLREMIQNPVAFHEKVTRERDRIMPMLIESEKMPVAELLKRAKQIKPLMRIAKNSRVFIYDELVNAKDSQLFFLKPVDLRQSYFFQFDIKKSLETTEKGIPLQAKGLKEVGRFVCYHHHGGYMGFLRPSTDEVLQQLPKDIEIDKISAFEIVFASSDIRETYYEIIDRHVSTVILYELENGLPEQVKEQKVIIDKVSYPFDLLCRCNGRDLRVSMNKADVSAAWGVFPFEDGLYLSLSENHKNFRSCFRENEIPFATDLYRIFGCKNELNVVLKRLGYPLLSGSYFVKEDFMPEEEKNCIINFDNDGKTGVYEDCEQAKFRFCGRFED